MMPDSKFPPRKFLAVDNSAHEQHTQALHLIFTFSSLSACLTMNTDFVRGIFTSPGALTAVTPASQPLSSTDAAASQQLSSISLLSDHHQCTKVFLRRVSASEPLPSILVVLAREWGDGGAFAPAQGYRDSCGFFLCNRRTRKQHARAPSCHACTCGHTNRSRHRTCGCPGRHVPG